jgi:hypothetical protein
VSCRTGSGWPRAKTFRPSRERASKRAPASCMDSRRWSWNLSAAAISAPLGSSSLSAVGISSLDFK